MNSLKLFADNNFFVSRATVILSALALDYFFFYNKNNRINGFIYKFFTYLKPVSSKSAEQK